MKKLCLFLALLMVLLTGCGGSDAAATEAMDMEMEMGMALAEDTAPAEPAEAPAAPAPEPEEAFAAGTGSSDADGFVGGEVSVNLSEKIIYTAYSEIETTDFEGSIETVTTLLSQYGGFIESSSVTGNDLQSTYNGYTSYRNATYSLRIPRENFSAVTAALPQIGNVLYLSHDATNITSQYTDTESRLNAYETEEARLLEILAKAETVEDLISVESRLSEVRYEMENLTSQLKNWDNQVSYSTVTLYIREVEILTPTPVEELTYWQEVGQSLRSTLRWLRDAGKGTLKFFIAGLPIFIPMAIIIAIPITVVHRKQKKSAARKTAEAAPKDNP